MYEYYKFFNTFPVFAFKQNKVNVQVLGRKKIHAFHVLKAKN